MRRRRRQRMSGYLMCGTANRLTKAKPCQSLVEKFLYTDRFMILIRNYLIIQSSTFSTLYHTEHRFSKIIIYVLTSMYSMMIWNMTYSRFHMLRQFFRLTGIFTNTALKEKVRVLTSHHLPVTISTGVRL